MIKHNLNYRHSIKSINHILYRCGHKLEKSGEIYYLLKRYFDKEITKTCGIYYKKSDAIENINRILNKFEAIKSEQINCGIYLTDEKIRI